MKITAQDFDDKFQHCTLHYQPSFIARLFGARAYCVDFKLDSVRIGSVLTYHKWSTFLTDREATPSEKRAIERIAIEDLPLAQVHSYKHILCHQSSNRPSTSR